jgi:hypothetical protein
MNALPPVEQRLVVKLAPIDAFALFTDGLARWWPFQGHSCSGEPVGVEFERRVGGTVTEVGRDGSRHAWGRLTVWDPPHGFAMTWHPGQSPDLATQLAVSFAAVAGGCELHLVHGGWEAHGDNAQAMRGNYDQGWGWVLGHYVELAGDAGR